MNSFNDYESSFTKLIQAFVLNLSHFNSSSNEKKEQQKQKKLSTLLKVAKKKRNLSLHTSSSDFNGSFFVRFPSFKQFC